MAKPFYTAETLSAQTSVGYLIKRCGSLMATLAEEAFADQSLTFTQWVVLMRLRDHDSHLSATQLSREVGHDMGALTRVVDALEREGYVRRERNETDRRAVEITLTSAGRRQAEACMSLILDLNNRLLEQFSRVEAEMLIGLLQRLSQHLQVTVDTPRENEAASATKKTPGKRSRRAS